VKSQQARIFSFTTRAPQRALVLQNEIHVTEVYDPGSGNPAPLQRSYVGIWDTGATGTVINRKIVDDLGLKPSGMSTVRAVGSGDVAHEYQANSYLVNLYLPNTVALVGIRAVEGTIAGADILVGMDVIGLGDFAVTHHEGKTTWSFRFPSCDEIDFVPFANEHNRRLEKTAASPEERRKAKNKAKAKRRKNH
jgi:hypothetical protein